MVGPIIRESLV